MFGNRLIVIGASAGGVEALKELISLLPADLPACILIVLHVPSYSVSMLPNILNHAGHLPASHPKNGQALEQGHIYIAPPDHHMLVKKGQLQLVRGPSENGHRPAVDPLFRTAAKIYNREVVGVILSGALDDGTAGLAMIKSFGGVTIAQNPEEALYPDMPKNAIDNVAMDYVLSVAEIGTTLTQLAQVKPENSEHTSMEKADYETQIEEFDMAAIETDDDSRPGVVSTLICPECGGTLWEIVEGDILRYRCHVGHGYSSETLRAEQTAALENALWVALRTLEDRATLAHRLKERSVSRNHLRAAERFQSEEKHVQESAKIIREVLLKGIIETEHKTYSDE